VSAHRVTAAAGVVRAEMEQGRTTAEEIAAALEMAQLLQDPETAARAARLQEHLDRRTAEASAVLELAGAVRAEDQREIGRLQARVAELEAAPTVIYRAEHPASGIVLGTYATADAARAHCEAVVTREMPTLHHLVWRPETDEEDSPVWLFALVAGSEVDTETTVTALEIAASYDEEANK
jgi:hypothetical protein